MVATPATDSMPSARHVRKIHTPSRRIADGEVRDSRHAMQGVPDRSSVCAVIRFLVRTAIVLVGNAVGLIVASLVFNGFRIDATGFIVSLVIFTVAVALLTPFIASVLKRNQSSSAALGGVALISTFAALLVTTLLTDGLSIDGIGTWIGATVVVWLGSLLAVFVLPYLGLKKYLEERRS
jgi:uncharacterized membrane protein YvlD (DUF360 family)